MRKSFVISYDDNDRQFVVGAVPSSALAPLLSDTLTANWSLDSLNFELTDDTARRLGVTALSVLALHNPELKPMLKVTPLSVPPIADSEQPS